MILDLIAQIAADDYEPRPRYTISIAGPFHRWLLNWFGYAAICWPWKRIYILEAYKDHATLRRHEEIHIEQIERHGALAFTVLYLWYAATRGYKANPFEIEAARRQTEVA